MLISCMRELISSLHIRRPSRSSKGFRRSPFDHDSTSGTDAYEVQQQPYRPALRTISSLPSSQPSSRAPAGLPTCEASTQPHRLAYGAEARSGGCSLSAATLPELHRESLPKGSGSSLMQPNAVEDAAGPSSTAAQHSALAARPSSLKSPSLPPSVFSEQAPKARHERSHDGGEESTPDSRGSGSGVQGSVSECDHPSTSAGRGQPEVAQDLGSWLWRPWMWVGVKRGIRRRAAQNQA